MSHACSLHYNQYVIGLMTSFIYCCVFDDVVDSMKESKTDTNSRSNPRMLMAM